MQQKKCTIITVLKKAVLLLSIGNIIIPNSSAQILNVSPKLRNRISLNSQRLSCLSKFNILYKSGLVIALAPLVPNQGQASRL